MAEAYAVDLIPVLEKAGAEYVHDLTGEQAEATIAWLKRKAKKGARS